MAPSKVVLVTGGNNGIGYEAVKAFLESEKAYHVLLGSRSLKKAETAIETLRKEVPDSKSTVEAVQIDLNSDESIQKAFEQVKASPGHIDALVNNAGTHMYIKLNLAQTNILQGPLSTSKSSRAKCPCAIASTRPMT